MFLIVAVVLGLREVVAMAAVVARVAHVVTVVAVVAALVVGVGVGVFLQAVWCVDLVVALSVCGPGCGEGCSCSFHCGCSCSLGSSCSCGGGGGRVKELQRGGLKLPSTPSQKNRTKCTVTVYSDNVQ